MEQELAEISRINMDGIIDNQLSAIEEKNRIIKRQRQEIMEMKKPKSTRFWVKVYKDTDVSFLSFRDRGILFSLCQLVGNNKGGYLEDKYTGGLIETWSQLGRNIGIKDKAHTASYCKKLVDRKILIVEGFNTDNGKVWGQEEYEDFKHFFRRDKRRVENMIDKRHFRINQQYSSIGKDK